LKINFPQCRFDIEHRGSKKRRTDKKYRWVVFSSGGQSIPWTGRC